MNSFTPLKFGGHCYFVRKCVTGKQVGDDPLRRALNGIELPQQFADRSLWGEVLAKGPNIGKPCARDHMHKFKRAKWLEDQVDIGDLVKMPPNSIGICQAPWNQHEYFVEESVPQAIIKQQKDT